MTRISKYAAAAVFTSALALAAATPSQARWHDGHDWHNGAGAAIGFGVGALAGAAAANAAYPGYYGYDYGYAPGYAYEPALRLSLRAGSVRLICLRTSLQQLPQQRRAGLCRRPRLWPAGLQLLLIRPNGSGPIA